MNRKFFSVSLLIVLSFSLSTLSGCGNKGTKDSDIAKKIQGTQPGNDKKTATENGKNTGKNQFPEIKQCKSLLIVAEDRSGSTHDHRKLTADDYSKLIHQFVKENYGQVAVRVIGNPAPAEREFFILRIDPLKKYKPVPPISAKMSVRAAVISDNKKINIENKQIMEENNNKIANFIEEIIKPKIIQYKPYHNKDITDVKDALQHLQIKTSESLFRSYDNIDVLLISDGKHDASKLQTPVYFEPENPVNLYLIGWEEDKDILKVSNIEEYDSFDSFMEAYYEKKCN